MTCVVSPAASSAGPVGTAGGRTGMVVLVDVTENLDKAKEALEKADKNLLKEGAKKSHKTVDCGDRSYDLPALLAGERGSPGSTPRRVLSEGRPARRRRRAIRRTDLLPPVWGKHDDSLSTLGPYQHVMKRLTNAAGELVPDVRGT